MGRHDMNRAVQHLFAAACDGDEQALARLHRLDIPLHLPLCGDGSTLLHHICSEGRAETARLLIHLLSSTQADPAALVAAVNAQDKQQRTPTWLAARLGDAGMLSMLLAAGAAPNAAAADGTRPLHLAAASGSREAVQLLLKAGAWVRAQALDKTTALDWALAAKQPGTAQELLDMEGGYQMEVPWLPPLPPPYHQALVPKGTRLLVACLLGHEEQAAMLLGAGANPHAVSICGSSALELAVHSGAAGIVRVLLEAGVARTSPGPDGLPALHRAVLCQQAEVVEVLLSSPEHMEPPPMWWGMPTTQHWVVGMPFPQRSLLLQHHDQYGRTPLFVAAAEGLLGMVQQLMAHGASCNRCDSNGSSALHVAAARGQVDTLQYMLQKEYGWPARHQQQEEPGDVVQQQQNQLDRGCMLELLQRPDSAEGVQQLEDGGQLQVVEHAEVQQAEEAAQMEDAERVDELQQSEEAWEDAEQLEQSEEAWEDAEQWEQSEEGEEAAQWEGAALLEAGDQPDMIMILLSDGRAAAVNQAQQPQQHLRQRPRAALADARDDHGATMLHYASAAGSAEIVRMLLEGGASPLLKDEVQRTALCYACASGSLDCVLLLAGDGTSITWGDVRGWQPLHFAAAAGNDVIVAALLAAKAQAVTAGQLQVTPLHLAAAAGHGAVVDLLLAAGAPVDAVDAGGSTPLHLASKHGHQAVAQQLMEAGADAGAADGAGRTARYLFSAATHELELDKLLAAAAVDDHCAAHPALGPGGCFWAAVQLLLGVSDCHVGRPDLGSAALHIAAAFGRSKVVRSLLVAGCDPVFVDSSGRNLLHVAAAHGHWATLQLVLDAALPRSAALVNDHDHGSAKQPRSTPLHLAAQHGHAACVATLLAAGAGPNLQDGGGATPLHRAVAAGHLYLVEQLATPANINMVVGGRTALHWAVAHEADHASRLVAVLLAHGASVVDQQGHSPLALADAQGDPTICAHLLCMQMEQRLQQHARHKLQRQREGQPTGGLAAACTGQLPAPGVVKAAKQALHHPSLYVESTVAVFSKVLARHGTGGMWQLLQSLLKPYEEAKVAAQQSGDPYQVPSMPRITRLVEVLLQGCQGAFHALLQQRWHVIEPLQFAAQQMMHQQNGHNGQQQQQQQQPLDTKEQLPAAAGTRHHQQLQHAEQGNQPPASGPATSNEAGPPAGVQAPAVVEAQGQEAAAAASQHPAAEEGLEGVRRLQADLLGIWVAGEASPTRLREVQPVTAGREDIPLSWCLLELGSVQCPKRFLRFAPGFVAKAAGVPWSELRQPSQGLYEVCEALLAVWQSDAAQLRQELGDAVARQCSCLAASPVAGGGGQAHETAAVAPWQ